MSLQNYCQTASEPFPILLQYRYNISRFYYHHKIYNDVNVCQHLTNSLRLFVSTAPRPFVVSSPAPVLDEPIAIAMTFGLYFHFLLLSLPSQSPIEQQSFYFRSQDAVRVRCISVEHQTLSLCKLPSGPFPEHAAVDIVFNIHLDLAAHFRMRSHTIFFSRVILHLIEHVIYCCTILQQEIKHFHFRFFRPPSPNAAFR